MRKQWEGHVEHGVWETETKTIYDWEEDSAIFINCPSSNGVVLNWLVAESSRWSFSSDESTLGRNTPVIAHNKWKLGLFSGEYDNGSYSSFWWWLIWFYKSWNLKPRTTWNATTLCLWGVEATEKAFVSGKYENFCQNFGA